MGLHCAYSVIPDEGLRKQFQNGYEPAMPTPFAIAGTIAAYNESEDWLDQLNEYLDNTMSFAVDYIKEKIPGVKVYLPQGSYVLWLDFSDFGYSDDVLQDIITRKPMWRCRRGYPMILKMGLGLCDCASPVPKPISGKPLIGFQRRLRNMKGKRHL